MEASHIRSSNAEPLYFPDGEGAIPMPTDVVFRPGDASAPLPAPLPPMWALEEAAQQVLDCLHPTIDSEEERTEIVNYLQILIKSNLDSEVFPYGSVPLKTYLPDGDIDLTIISNTGGSLADDVHALLQREEMNADAEFEIKDLKFIDAAECTNSISTQAQIRGNTQSNPGPNLGQHQFLAQYNPGPNLGKHQLVAI